MPWTDNVESHLEGVAELCKSLSAAHDKKRIRAKRLFNMFSVPSIMLPIIIGSMNEYIPYKIIPTMCLMIVGLLNGISTFYNFGKKQESHSQFEDKYDKLGSYIRNEMVKSKKYRVDSDVFLERINIRFEQLNSTAPDL